MQGKKVILLVDTRKMRCMNLDCSCLLYTSDEGYELYEHLFYMGVKLVFLKEPHINTDVYLSLIHILIVR